MTDPLPSASLLLRPDGALADRAGGQRHALVRICAPAGPGPQERKAISLALVLDRSGSMEGTKLTRAKQAVLQALDHLTERDRIAVVAYDHHVQLVLPAGAATAAHKAEAETALGNLLVGGRTDMVAGWLHGCQEADQQRGERLGRCLVLTDGLTNTGITDPAVIADHAVALRQRGMVTSTLGVGDDFDEALLAGLAESGGGTFHDIASGDGIPAAVERELGEALAVTCVAVQLALTPGAGMWIEVLGPWATTLGSNNALVLRLPDLVSNQVLDIPLRLDLPPDAETPLMASLTIGGQPASTAETSWRAADREQVLAQELDPEVLEAVALALAARARREALALKRAGEDGKASRTMQQATTHLGSMTSTSQLIMELKEQLANEAAIYAAPMSRRDLKERLAASENEAHGRKRDGTSRRR